MTNNQEPVNPAAQLAALKEGIALLRSYLQSPKFHVDTTVQVSDVLTRLAEVEQAAADAEDATTDHRIPIGMKADELVTISDYRYRDVRGNLWDRMCRHIDVYQFGVVLLDIDWKTGEIVIRTASENKLDLKLIARIVGNWKKAYGLD